MSFSVIGEILLLLQVEVSNLAVLRAFRVLRAFKTIAMSRGFYFHPFVIFKSFHTFILSSFTLHFYASTEIIRS